MNRITPVRIIKYLTVTGLILASIYVAILAISAIQIANDNATCSKPLDQLDRADYQFCLSRELR